MFLPFCLHGGQRLRERKHEQETDYNPYERFDVDPDDDDACPYDTDKSREELTFSSCTSLDDVTPWCYTRIQVGRGLFQHGRGIWENRKENMLHKDQGG